MQPGRRVPGLGWYLGTIQYSVALFGGGALWFLLARATGFFAGDPLVQLAAVLLLLALIAGEAMWSYGTTFGHRPRDYLADVLSSAAITAFGMAIVLAIYLVVPR